MQPSSLQCSSFLKEGGSKAGSSHFNEKILILIGHHCISRCKGFFGLLHRMSHSDNVFFFHVGVSKCENYVFKFAGALLLTLLGVLGSNLILRPLCLPLVRNMYTVQIPQKEILLIQKNIYRIFNTYFHSTVITFIKVCSLHDKLYMTEH